MSPLHFLFVTVICLVWGFNFIAVKTGLEGLPPLLFTALRFLLVMLLLIPFLRPLPGRLRQVAGIALFGGALHFALLFLSLTMAGASVVGITVQLSVPIATLLSMLFLSEVVRWRRWLGIGLSFAGVVVIGFDPNVTPVLGGVMVALLGASCMAVATILMRRLKGVRPLELQSWMALLSWPPLLALSLLVEADHLARLAAAPPVVWACVAYTAIGASIIGHSGYYYLLQRYEVSLTGPLTLMTPVFAMTFGITLLGEPVTWRIVAGAAITLAGVLIIALRGGVRYRQVMREAVQPGAVPAPLPQQERITP